MKTATKALNLYSTGVGASSLQAFSSQSDIFTVGAGYLNISAALASRDLTTLPALSPTVVRDATTGKFGVVRNFSICWGDSMVWGDSAIFGNTVFSSTAVTAADESIVWGDSMVWGDSTAAGFSVVWGDSMLTSATTQPFDVSDEDQ